MDKKLPQLCPSAQCTACSACAQVCKHDALTMEEDEHGFLHPHLDEDKCIGCLLCETHCPINHDNDNRNERPSKVYAAWNKNEEIRMVSSSGGIFTAIAEHIINIGGVVWGAAYDNHLHLSYQCTTNTEELQKLRRSKYVQSEVGDAFLKIKEQLKAGTVVLFAGTSCHVRGLYQIIGERLKERLFTIDFICHGVPSPKVFSDYITWIENRYKDKLVDFNFRDKRYGWDNGILTVGRFVHLGEKNSCMTRIVILQVCSIICSFENVATIAVATA